MKTSIVGFGKVGQAYHKLFPDAIVYDPNLQEANSTKQEVNETDMAIVCVPTDLKDGQLDMSIVEEVVDWLETPLILIKSALQPGTVDRLVKKTSKKIAVSVELVGQGSYYIDPSKYPDPNNPAKHQTLMIGGEEETATKCAEVLWERMSPTITIHLLTALEAEITKLVENTYGALKVTWVNTLMSLAQKSGANFIKIHQAWQSDPRVEGMHQRAISYKRGWSSHCWAKDPKALSTYSNKIGAKDMHELIELMLKLNEEHKLE